MVSLQHANFFIVFFFLFQLTADKRTDPINLEQFQHLAVSGSRKHNLPFFEEEQPSPSTPGMEDEVVCRLCTRSIPTQGKSHLTTESPTEEEQKAA